MERPDGGRYERRTQFLRKTFTVLLISLAFSITLQVSSFQGFGNDRNTPSRKLTGFWCFGSNRTRDYHRELKWITRKLMRVAFETVDKNRSGYLEFDEVVSMMHVFYYMSRLDMIDYMIEDLPEIEANTTASVLANEYFGNVTNSTYEEEARAFIEKTDKNGDGKLSRREMEASMEELTAEFNKRPITPEQYIYYLSYFVGTLYRNGMLDGKALEETQVMHILDSTKDPKEAKSAVQAYMKKVKSR
mmetsp:Transcript_21625/g.32191  ORF Transcript_21625/g.32191 Transcript_21625/m.32191 type:complete len:246 (+) Transcript_21625:55-792(+)